MVTTRAALGGLVVVYAAAVTPLVTHWRFGGLPFDHAVTLTPQIVLVVALLVVLGLEVGAHDHWLGGFVVYAAVSVLWTPLEARALGVAQFIALGGLAIVAVRRIPTAWRPAVSAGCAALGLVQLWKEVLELAQIDVYWPARLALIRAGELTPSLVGTVGNAGWLAAFLAMLVPIAPLLPVPVTRPRVWRALAPWSLRAALLTAILCTGNRLGLFAALAGLVVTERARIGRRAWWVIGLASTSLVVAAAGLVLARLDLRPVAGRWAVTKLGLVAWLTEAPLFGFGGGTWWTEIPRLQKARDILVGVEYYGQAHNEVLQLGFEFGLVGIGFLVVWLIAHRHALRTSPYLGAGVSLCIVSLGLFPFHVAQLGASGLLILGLVTAPASVVRAPRDLDVLWRLDVRAVPALVSLAFLLPVEIVRHLLRERAGRTAVCSTCGPMWHARRRTWRGSWWRCAFCGADNYFTRGGIAASSGSA